MLIERQPTHSLYLLSIKKTILLKGEETIEGINSSTFVLNYQQSLNGSEEALVTQFNVNQLLHTDAYNSLFNNIMFGNICNSVDLFIEKGNDCISFNNGILKNGIHATVVQYWDYLWQIFQQFQLSDKSDTSIKSIFSNTKLDIAETMQKFYFNESYSLLGLQLEGDISNS